MMSLASIYLCAGSCLVSTVGITATRGSSRSAKTALGLVDPTARPSPGSGHRFGVAVPSVRVAAASQPALVQLVAAPSQPLGPTAPCRGGGLWSSSGEVLPIHLAPRRRPPQPSCAPHPPLSVRNGGGGGGS